VIECFLPADSAEGALPLLSLSNRRIEQSIFAIQPFAEAADLGTDVSAGNRIDIAAIDLDDASFFNGDVERAGVRAIERAGGADG